MERWASEMEQGDKDAEPEATNSETPSRSGTPMLPNGEERAPKKRVKFADETSSDSELSESSRVSSSQGGSENSTKMGGILKYPGSPWSSNRTAEKQAVDLTAEDGSKLYTDVESAPSEIHQMADSSSKQGSENEGVSESDVQTSSNLTTDPQTTGKSEQDVSDSDASKCEEVVQAQGKSQLDPQTTDQSEDAFKNSEKSDDKKLNKSEEAVSPVCETKDIQTSEGVKSEENQVTGTLSEMEGVDCKSAEAPSDVKGGSEISTDSSSDSKKSDFVAGNEESGVCSGDSKISGDMKQISKPDSISEDIIQPCETSEKMEVTDSAESSTDAVSSEMKKVDVEDQSASKDSNESDSGKNIQSEILLKAEAMESAKVDQSAAVKADQSEELKIDQSDDCRVSQSPMNKPQDVDTEKSIQLSDTKDSLEEVKAEKSSESEAVKTDSSKQENSEAAKTGSKTDSSEIVSLASSLLKKWSDLKVGNVGNFFCGLVSDFCFRKVPLSHRTLLVS